jgi:cyclopropane-fatty-acyl-phospholipid synthase
LESLEKGRITVIEQDRSRTFGQPDDLEATVYVNDPGFFSAVVFGGSVGAGEAYMAGYWNSDDLTSLIRIFARNIDLFINLDSGLGRICEPFDRILHSIRRNTRIGSRRNIHSHYDLGNDFFSLMLDGTMMYSSAIFESENQSLYHASVNKIETVCRKLQLRPEDHLLEIGTGWGSLAIHAARRYGCRVTTATISKEQYNLALKRTADAGVTDRVSIRLCDYRDLEGKFDKLVSIEMIEAVGKHYWDDFYKKCRDLLRNDGKLLLQAIVISEEYFRRALKSVDFIKKHIFPGSCLPSVSSIRGGLAKQGLELCGIEDITPDYARTLRIWKQNFYENIRQVRDLGYSKQFIRMWEFYLSYCEGGFSERHIGDVQMLFHKR